MKKLGKRILIPAVVLALLVFGVSATLLTYFGRVTTTVNVERAVTLTGEDCTENICTRTETAIGGNTIEIEEAKLTSSSDADIPIEIVSEPEPDDSGVKSIEQVYKLTATGTMPREDRIRIRVEDIEGVETLGDLDTITFQQDVLAGYVAHVDVKIDTDGDGIADDALVFEYAKVDPGNCDNAPYPTGKMNTFGDKGILDNDAYAWLNSGDPGPCGGATFYHHSLDDWKSGQIENGKTIDEDTAIIAIEFEADSWIYDSTVKIKELEINGVSQDVIIIESGEEIDFSLEISFANGATGDYTIETQVDIKEQ